MEIIKYSSKRSTKGKMVDQIFEFVELPCEVKTLYVEDIGERAIIGKGITSLPAIMVKHGDNKILLSGDITPKKLKDAIEAVQ